MPTYSYRCLECGHEFDLFQKITEEPANTCPSCQVKDRVQRQIGGGSALFRFQGNGYYQTDVKGRAPEKAPQEKRCPCPCGKPPSGCTEK